jgi:hypothetical protein
LIFESLLTFVAGISLFLVKFECGLVDLSNFMDCNIENEEFLLIVVKTKIFAGERQRCKYYFGIVINVM